MSGNSHQRRTRRRRSERSYDAFFASCCSACRCCRYCSMAPCQGVSAGGFCDGLCFCGGDDPDDDYQYGGREELEC